MTPTHTGPTATRIASSAVATDATAADMAVESAVRAMLANSVLGRSTAITVAVHDRVVTLDGVVSDGLPLARFKNQLTAAIPSITIDDRIDWVVPDCGIGMA